MYNHGWLDLMQSLQQKLTNRERGCAALYTCLAVISQSKSARVNVVIFLSTFELTKT